MNGKTLALIEKNRPAEPTTGYIADLILTLRKALQDEYGAHYSFTIAGGGKTIAASNYVDGVIEPISR